MRESGRCEFDETDCMNDSLSVDMFVPFTVDCFLNMIDQLQKKTDEVPSILQDEPGRIGCTDVQTVGQPYDFC